MYLLPVTKSAPFTRNKNMNDSVIVTSQEVTDRLAQEIGILTVNNLMQTIQIEKLHAKIEYDIQVISRLNNTIVSQSSEIQHFIKKLEVEPTTKKKK